MRMLFLSLFILLTKTSSAAEVGDYAKFMDQNLRYGTLVTYEIRIVGVNKDKTKFRVQHTRYNYSGEEIGRHRYNLTTHDIGARRANVVQIADNCEQYGVRGTLQIKDRTIETCQYKTGHYYGAIEKWVSKDLPDYLGYAKSIDLRDLGAMVGLVTLLEWGHE